MERKNRHSDRKQSIKINTHAMILETFKAASKKKKTQIEGNYTCSYKGVSLRVSAFHWNPLTLVVMGLFLLVAFSMPFLTPATSLMAGFETNPLRLGFGLLPLSKKREKQTLELSSESAAEKFIESKVLVTHLPVLSGMCLTFLPTPAPLFPNMILMCVSLVK